jgi:alkylation response protein AidB-like acyl-CoA dehydrogenase
MSLDLSLSNSEEILKSTTRDFLFREIPKETLQSFLDSDTGYTETIRRKVADIGWFGIIIPEKFGGIGYPLTSAGILFETLGSCPLPGPYFSSGIIGGLLIMEGSNETQQQEWLPAVANGDIIISLALTEPEYSWHPYGINMRAKRAGGEFLLNGIKLFVADAMAATHFVVVTRTEENEKALSEGISLFLVGKHTKGVSVRKLHGFLTGQAFEVKFDNVKLSSAELLGEMNEGWPVLERVFEKSIPVLCAYKVGGCQAVFDMALDYSRKRIQFSQPIGRFQRVQDMIIEMINHTDAARWTTYEALWKSDTQQSIGESVHLAKAIASEAYWQVCTLAHRVFSGISYSMEHSVSNHTRTSRNLYNFLGDPTYHRQQIAKMLLC